MALPPHETLISSRPLRRYRAATPGGDRWSDEVPSREKLLEVIAIQTEVARLGLDLGGVMDLVVQRTLGLVAADGAAIEMAEGEDMVYRATAGIADGSLGLRLHRDRSLSGMCVALGGAQCCDDAQVDGRADQAACRNVGLRSMIVVPLRHHDETVGVLKAMSSRRMNFNTHHVKLLELLSELVGAVMYHATRYAPSELFHKATHDGLTELPNRGLFLDRLRAALAVATRERRSLAVVMLDMNGLKAINDRFGHRVGDAALREFALRLAACVRQADTAARLGGDEFALLLHPGAGDEQGVLQRLGDCVNGRFSHQGLELPVSASLGLARFPDDGLDPLDLLERADQRMYEDKRARCLARGLPA